MRRRRRRTAASLEANDWVEYGAERIWAAGYTSGGAPYGLLEGEYERAIDASGREKTPWPDWWDARDALYELTLQAGVVPERSVIGRIRRIGVGLSNIVFHSTVRLHNDSETEVVIKLPLSDASPDRDARLRAEAALLRYLATKALPFATARAIGEAATRAGVAFVEEWVDGLQVDLRAARFPDRKPWEFVAWIAAAVHAVDPDPIRGVIPSHLSRRDHAAARAAMLQTLDEAEARDSEAWIRAHLPPDTAAVLLHGDLLGQNLRWSWDDAGRIGVIDWAEAMIGDPAYDLAIVTRGHRNPFATVGGLTRLVDAYNRLAESPLTVADVHVHELILHAGLYRAALMGHGRGSAYAEHCRSNWRSLLRRVRQGAAEAHKKADL